MEEMVRLNRQRVCRQMLAMGRRSTAVSGYEETILRDDERAALIRYYRRCGMTAALRHIINLCNQVTEYMDGRSVDSIRRRLHYNNIPQLLHHIF